MLVSLYKGACDIDISVDVAKRLVADAKKDYLVERYSEGKKSAEELSARVKQRAV